MSYNKRYSIIVLIGIMLAMFFFIPVRATSYTCNVYFWKVTSQSWISEPWYDNSAEPYMQVAMTGGLDDYSSYGEIGKYDTDNFNEYWYHGSVTCYSGDTFSLNFYEDDGLFGDDFIDSDSIDIDFGTGTYYLLASQSGFNAYAKVYVT